MIAAVVPSLDGVWKVDVYSATSRGTCFMALRDGRLVGADLSYYFTGNYTLNGSQLIATLRTKHYSGPENTLWGPADGVELEFRGDVNERAMELVGHFVGEPTQGHARALLTKLAAWPIV
jgi:hypothetical protein